jgi:hypothetical protein
MRATGGAAGGAAGGAVWRAAEGQGMASPVPRDPGPTDRLPAGAAVSGPNTGCRSWRRAPAGLTRTYLPDSAFTPASRSYVASYVGV